jgi:hypothetical protein
MTLVYHAQKFLSTHPLKRMVSQVGGTRHSCASLCWIFRSSVASIVRSFGLCWFVLADFWAKR